jgi:excisionase family DNA binding protein
MSSLLTVGEVASRLRMSTREVYRLCESKEVSHLRIGSGRSSIRVEEAAIEDYLRRSRVERKGGGPKLRFLK